MKNASARLEKDYKYIYACAYSTCEWLRSKKMAYELYF